MTIIELGRQTQLTQRTTPLDTFTRVVYLGDNNVDAGLLAEFPGLEITDSPTIIITGVRTREGAVLDERDSVADLSPLSFYFDFPNQVLYFKMPATFNFTEILLFGVGQGFTDGSVAYIDDVEYLPTIKNAPTIRQQQDVDGYSKLSFITGTITISNNDGRLDELRHQPIYGNDVIMYYLQAGTSENYVRSDLVRIASLFVEDYDISLQELALRIQDRRTSQNASIPTARFNSTDYPNASDEVLGEVIPVLWGTARETPTVITNGETTAGNVHYRAALLLTALGTVFVDDVDVTASVENLDLTTGEFELPAAQGREGEIPKEAVLRGATGINTEEGEETIYAIGDAGEGGIVVYDKGNFDGGWRYLEAPATEVASLLNYENALNAIAELDEGGRQDWTMPTIEELREVYENRAELTYLRDESYWSSEIVGERSVLCKQMASGLESDLVKSNHLRYLPVRKILTVKASIAGIIRDANSRFLGIDFNSSNYNITEWLAETSAIAEGSYYLNESKEFFELILDLQNGANVGFRYEVDADGRRTIRIDDETRAIALPRVNNLKVQNRDDLPVRTDASRVAAEVVVKYDRSFASGRFLRVTDDSELQTVLDTYNRRPRRTFDTFLTSAIDAQERASYVLTRFSTVRGIVTLVLMGREFLTLRIYDILEVDICPEDELTEGREFYGLQKIKVLSIAPNTRTATNEITAELIEEITE